MASNKQSRFDRDVEAALAKFDKSVENVLEVKRGEAKGSVIVCYSGPGDVVIVVYLQVVDQYPDEHSFLISAPNVQDTVVCKALDNLQGFSFGQTVSEMIWAISRALSPAQPPSPSVADPIEPRQETQITDAGGDEPQDSGSEDDFGIGEEEDDDDTFGLRDEPTPPGQTRHTTEATQETVEMLRRDLREARGTYRIGIMEGVEVGAVRHMVSVSTRISKLGLSPDALQAWDLDSSDYVVLLMRIHEPYPSIDTLPRGFAKDAVEFRIGRCRKYKPSKHSCRQAFAVGKERKTAEDDAAVSSGDDTDPNDFHKIFLSTSLERFMNDNFLNLVRIRSGTREGSWDTAIAMLKQLVIAQTPFGEALSDFDQPNISNSSSGQPSNDLQDHFNTHAEPTLCLVALQFALHFIAHCTKYCVCCYSRLQDGFESLKPYVDVDHELCLYQYLTLGMGPSVEHELLTQPYVVNLLIDLCYASVQSRNGVAYAANSNPGTHNFGIREFPVGLRLKVPGALPRQDRSKCSKVTMITDQCTLLLVEDPKDLQRIGVGAWAVLRQHNDNPNFALSRVSVNVIITAVDFQSQTILCEIRGLAPVFFTPAASVRGPPSTPLAANSIRATRGETLDLFIYDTDLDDLDASEKAFSMSLLLNTLPTIPEMREYVQQNPHSSLRAWKERISPAAASLLEWIVASNRSCIYQVGSIKDRSGAQAEELALGINTRDAEKIPGMGGWIQFRFAQGSPDKEVRFEQALQACRQRRGGMQVPTMYAWHGSPLLNWHSILRTGLDFRQILHGRGCGNGIYFSPHLTTSTGYSGGAIQTWPNSSLKIMSAISLNEIVNAPDEFVASQPHYVVQHVDWTQCRYLFVQQSTAPLMYANGAIVPQPPPPLVGFDNLKAAGEPSQGPFVQQDPSRPVFGADYKTLRIPTSAVRRSRLQAGPVVPQKRAGEVIDLTADDAVVAPQVADTSDVSPPKSIFIDLTLSDSEPDDPEDMHYFATEGQMLLSGRLAKRRNTNSNVAMTPPLSATFPETDFVPGALDLASLPQLPSPTWATPTATKQLASTIKTLRRLQDETAPATLGWYVDFDNIQNLFHWIVEFHSFDASTPLAKDMKAAGVKSIVFEVRFNSDFPFSPPFLRVIRPHFLPLLQGGGGHVTSGGAMCMELLTSSGWLPSFSMDNVFLQVRLALTASEPPARLATTALSQGGGVKQDYNVFEAIEAFKRAVGVHGWKLPRDLADVK